ncbi:hypothetical protein N9025_02220 [Synechococcus sp. AH-707-B22]|nr:hypothetical protein [Synechococcus sp. AH-707-B22]
MSTTPEWVHEPEASKLLTIKPFTLRNMRREPRLDAEMHWVYATGSIGAPVVYNISAIREMQRRRRSFSCQFHPELLDDLREFSKSGLPEYSALKQDYGVQLLVRILYEAIKE